MADKTPAAWLELLEHRLDARWAVLSPFDSAYEGDQALAKWLTSVRNAFQGTVLGNLLNNLANNYMPLVVDSAAERLQVQGFRFDDAAGDKDAWDIWQRNGLDGEANLLHTEAIKLAEAYWLVDPNKGNPIITAEHPSQVIVATAPGNRRVRLAALKRWQEDDGFVYANVYLPNYVVKYRTKEKVGAGTPRSYTQIEFGSNRLGEVPIIPAPNNPSMLRGGKSDLAGGILSLQDQIVKTVADLLIGSEYHGLPQRVILGVEPPRDENGKVIPFDKAAKSRLWYFNNENAKAHEFSQADLKGLREAIDGTIGDIAAQTRIPIYYFRPAAISNISAEALIGLDAGLVSKVNDKKIPFGEAHEEAIRLAFKAIDPNDARAKATSAETIWADTESRSMAQVADAASKKKDIGVPWEQLMEDLGYSPQQIARMNTQRATDSLLTDAVAPAVAPAN